MAINIYLDTHHISRAASGQSQISRFFLNPNFCFIYSAIHILESLPKEPRENLGAIKRLSIIMEPKAKSVVGWGNVTEIEKRNEKCDLESLICDLDQVLFPQFAISRADWSKRIRDGMKEVLVKQTPDQNLRRSCQAKFLKHGKLTQAAFQFLRGQLDATSRQVASDMPQAMPMLGAGGVYDFLEGKTSEEAFTRKFKEALANPISLALLSTSPDLASILDFSKFFWIYAAQLNDILSRLASKLINEQLQTDVFDYAKVRGHVEDGLHSTESRLSVVRHFSGVEVSSDQLNRMSGTRVFVDVFLQYVLEKMDRYANKQSPEFGMALKIKRSDAADLSHIFYFPYVDYFGCDNAMRDRIRRAGWPTNNVFTTDAELEAKIAEAANCD